MKRTSRRSTWGWSPPGTSIRTAAPRGDARLRVELHEPGVETISRLLRANAAAGIKLAPAGALPPEWAGAVEREWIESRGECRQQVAWFGSLCHAPGQCTATVLVAVPAGEDADRASAEAGREPWRPFSIRGQPDQDVPVASGIGRFVFEPSAAVLAARLTGALAEQQGLSAITPGIAYLTGAAPIENPLLACFEVDEVVPFDIKRLRGLLRERDIGRLEVKTRGVGIDPPQTIKALKPPGTRAATLLLLPLRGSVVAILARRAGNP